DGFDLLLGGFVDVDPRPLPRPEHPRKAPEASCRVHAERGLPRHDEVVAEVRARHAWAMAQLDLLRPELLLGRLGSVGHGRADCGIAAAQRQCRNSARFAPRTTTAR